MKKITKFIAVAIFSSTLFLSYPAMAQNTDNTTTTADRNDDNDMGKWGLAGLLGLLGLLGLKRRDDDRPRTTTNRS
ncbi:MAG: WGxxGxxG family protein [Chitinophagaceae bacterium]